MDSKKNPEQDNPESQKIVSINLKIQWADFSKAFFSPRTIFWFLGAFFLIAILANYGNGWFTAIFSLLISLIMGVAINRFEKLYSESQEQHPMIRRGITAIRRLGVLIEQVRLLESRISNIQYQLEGKDELSPAVMKTNLEELKNRCLSLQLAGFSSIEDWTNLLPDANIASLHGQVIAKFLHERDIEMQKVRVLNEQLARNKGQTAEERATIKAQLSVKEKEISVLNELLTNSRTPGLWATYTAEPSTIFDVTSGELVADKCRVCGESYYKSTRNWDPWGRCTRCVSEGRMPE